MLHELYIPESDGFERRYTTRDEIAGNIRKLAQLGRTDRWQVAIENWARAVESEANLDWAFLQYGIWAGYAS